MWYATKETEDGFKKDFDEFGDSYTEEVNADELNCILKNVQAKVSGCFSSRLSSSTHPGLF